MIPQRSKPFSNPRGRRTRGIHGKGMPAIAGKLHPAFGRRDHVLRRLPCGDEVGAYGQANRDRVRHEPPEAHSYAFNAASFGLDLDFLRRELIDNLAPFGNVRPRLLRLGLLLVSREIGKELPERSFGAGGQRSVEGLVIGAECGNPAFGVRYEPASRLSRKINIVGSDAMARFRLGPGMFVRRQLVWFRRTPPIPSRRPNIPGWRP